MMPLTPWVKRILLANVVVFLVTASSPVLYRALWLYPPVAMLRPWTVVTYMFLHAGFGHLFFNMIGLYFFGPRLEDRLGGKGFLALYFLSGLGGAILHGFFSWQAPVVGASGAVYGILMGFAMYWPRERIYLWMILPVEAWLLATLLVAGSLWSGIGGGGSRTAHFAHLGGAAFAFAFLKWWDWQKGAGKRAFKKAMAPSHSTAGVSDRTAVNRWKGISLEGLHELNRDEVVRLLAKVEEGGASSLTEAEREFLDRMTAT